MDAVRMQHMDYLKRTYSNKRTGVIMNLLLYSALFLNWIFTKKLQHRPSCIKCVY